MAPVKWKKVSRGKNNGMVEKWNIGFQKGINHFNLTNNPTLHYPLRAVGPTSEPEARTH
jgi:hypothetical protein